MHKFATIPALALLLLFAASASASSSGNLLTNGDFETGDTSGWSSLSGDIAIASQSHSGSWSARLTSDGQSTVARMWQTVAVEGGATYLLSGWSLIDDPNVDRVLFRIQWLNATGTVLSEEDSSWLQTSAIYATSSTREVPAPNTAVSARISAFAYGLDSDPFYATFDDVVFEQLAPAPPTVPPTVPPTPVPTAPPTSPATPAQTAQPATPKPATPKPATQQPTRTPTPTPRPTATPVVPPIAPGPEPSTFSALTNGGFEQAGEEGVYGWRKIGGTVARSGAARRTDAYSLALSSTTTSTKWAYQTVTVQTGQWYRASAFAFQSGPPGEMFLRLSWYASNDGGGEAIANDDSTGTVSGGGSAFQALETKAVQAPPGARSVRVRLMFRPASATSATAYFDDASLGVVPPPSTSPTTSATPVPTAEGRASTPRATTRPGIAPEPTDEPATPGPGDDEPTVFTSLVNGGFEEAREDGTPFAWRKVGGSIAVSPANRTSGELALELSSDTASTKWAYQAVRVTSGQHYRATAWALNTAPGDELLLRISWYAATDGSGSSLADADSDQVVTGAASGFRLLDTGAARAPDGARSARIRMLLRPASSTPTLAYFDDVTFEPVAAPAGRAVSGAISGGSSGRSNTSEEDPGSAEGGPSGSGEVTAGPVYDGGPDGWRADSPASRGRSNDWLLALAISVPAMGIGGVLGVPYVRRRFMQPPEA